MKFVYQLINDLINLYRICRFRNKKFLFDIRFGLIMDGRKRVFSLGVHRHIL